MKESTYQKITRKTGRKPIECKCQACKQQCKTPCLGTPQDILKIIESGFGDRLFRTHWAVGLLLGHLGIPNAIFLILPEDKKEIIRDQYFFYDWDEATGEIRFMTSFDTTKEDIDSLIEFVKKQCN